jgi:hypothetical protein
MSGTEFRLCKNCSKSDISSYRKCWWGGIDTLNESIKKLDKLPISMRLIKQMHKTLLSSGRGKNKSVLLKEVQFM